MSDAAATNSAVVEAATAVYEYMRSLEIRVEALESKLEDLSDKVWHPEGRDE